MKKYIIILNILISVLIGFQKVGFISDVDGYVEIISQYDKSDIEVQALEGRYIYENDIIRSYNNSYCVIIFEDQTALFSMVGNSEIYFNNIDKNIKKIKFNYGKIYIENKSKIEPVFIFTQSSQIHSLNSSLFLSSSIDGGDNIYSILNTIDIYNKKSKLSLNLKSDNKAISLKGGDIELQKKEQNFLPKEVLASIENSSEMLITPLKELGRNRGDLVPDYLANYKINVYETKKKKRNSLEIGSSLSYLNDNLYSKVLINSQYKSPSFFIDLELAHYIGFKDAPNINLWDEPIKILAKIRELTYSNKTDIVKLRTGALNQITIGHGLLVKNYTNRLNYPFNNSYGVDFEYSNKNFLNLNFFSSNLVGGFIGFHSSLFVSKYLPLKLGFGAVIDANQFAQIKDPFSLSARSIKTFEFDSTYDLYNKKGYDIDLISEIAAIIFPDTHYYKRYNSSEDLAGALKKKNGTWGTALGIQGFYSQFLRLKTLIHYNDPLFTPSFFNQTYDFERYRLLAQKESYSDNIEKIDEMFSDFEHLDNLTVVPKDLYLSYSDNEFVYSSSGFTFEGEYNYYDKILTYISYSTFFEVGNPSDSNSKSSIDLRVEILDKVLKNINKIEFYYSKNISDKILALTDLNENTSFGLSLRSKIKLNLLFDFNFERVNYDFDFDGAVDNVDILEIGLTYKL